MIILGILGNAQGSIDGFQLNKELGVFQINDPNTGSPWFSDVSAAFKFNGEWFTLKDLDSKNIKVSSGHSTFGEAEKLTWDFEIISRSSPNHILCSATLDENKEYLSVQLSEPLNRGVNHRRW